MDECLRWPLQVQAGRASENKRNWFGPPGGESMCWGHDGASVVLCTAVGPLQSLRGISDLTAEFCFSKCAGFVCFWGLF